MSSAVTETSSLIESPSKSSNLEGTSNGTPKTNPNGLPKTNPVEFPGGLPKTNRTPARPNFRQIHARPLPVEVYPLPSFQAHNPLSLLLVVCTLLKDFFFPPSSHSSVYQGYFSSKTRSVHVTDVRTIRALWEMGFFGKGTLSRSEPNWLDLERRRLGLVAFETAEERTARRRREREDFKRERARIEREMVEEQRLKEANALFNGSVLGTSGSEIPKSDHTTAAEVTATIAGTRAREIMEQRKAQSSSSQQPSPPPELETTDIRNEEPIDQEHLQLSLEEAFFLIYAIGTLHLSPPRETTNDTWSTLQLFRQHSHFPPIGPSALQPDDPFLLRYAVYHHFRSLGWVVRDGVKFAVDYLLYERGPVFTHAAFAVLIIPSYSDAYWFADPRRREEVQRKRRGKNWAWFHCASRVQNQVIKTLVLCYVDVPKPMAEGKRDVGGLLRGYRVREFCVQRWSPNRNRD